MRELQAAERDPERSDFDYHNKSLEYKIVNKAALAKRLEVEEVSFVTLSVMARVDTDMKLKPREVIQYYKECMP